MRSMGESEVVLLGWPLSMFGARVKIALAEKGVKYEYKEEVFLHNKSPLLLKCNPIHKKIPVLIHKGRSVCESKIIVEYIDELWKGESPLLPSDPYLRSQARFWADYIDKVIYTVAMKFNSGPKGEEMQKARHECLGYLNVLEGELGEKPYFMGDAFGYVDIALMSYYNHFFTYETLGGFSLKINSPKLFAWATRCMKRESVSKSLPDPQKIYDYTIVYRKNIGVED
ncbi:probable glutathione S-transferase [Lactuca sativa]|uniref:probable glutathione S-transferase n=1 Tax=Lactuca sativa TaxID=4236 RepID=UPI000CD88421|nr:probable glutathione S-transferase [Lactuca sativa]